MINKQKKKYFHAPRLKNFNYSSSYCYFITICTHKRSPYFTSLMVVNDVQHYLRKTTNQMNYTILAYCFMPDHLHCLLSGDSQNNLVKFAQRFKQLSGFHFKQQYEKPLWERSFYDHILRKTENIKEVALYILNNPVRKGLVEDYHDYPYLGSDVFEI